MKKLIALLVLCAVCGCSSYEVKSGAPSFAPRDESGGHIPAQVVKDATRRAHKLFTYESDVDAEWTSYGAELALGIEFKGDCEDFALSVADYLTGLGFSRRHMALARANVGWIPVKGSYNHAILIVSTEEGQIAVDNNSKRAVSVNFYDASIWHSLRRMDAAEWRAAEIMKK